jgi:hypothetical protein
MGTRSPIARAPAQMRFCFVWLIRVPFPAAVADKGIVHAAVEPALPANAGVWRSRFLQPQYLQPTRTWATWSLWPVTSPSPPPLAFPFPSTPPAWEPRPSAGAQLVRQDPWHARQGVHVWGGGRRGLPRLRRAARVPLPAPACRGGWGSRGRWGSRGGGWHGGRGCWGSRGGGWYGGRGCSWRRCKCGVKHSHWAVSDWLATVRVTGASLRAQPPPSWLVRRPLAARLRAASSWDACADSVVEPSSARCVCVLVCRGIIPHAGRLRPAPGARPCPPRSRARCRPSCCRRGTRVRTLEAPRRRGPCP